jgi:apolipoprotein N-acyltransferase
VAVLLLSAFIPFAFAPATANGDQKTLRVAGVQLEFQPTDQIIAELDRVFASHPDTDLFVLSEYTMADELPARINQWCRENRKHLIIGAKDRLSPDRPVRGNHYYNTAFVIDPQGEVVFRQAKSVPIQFFQDGQPAPSRAVWDSPWGKIGIGVCYDLSYSRVMDDLVRLGAELLIIPTMDVVDWGEYEHQLHSRVTPIRAAEYDLPIFRLSSSGISQSVDAKGRVRAIAPFPGQGEIIADELLFAEKGHLPIDRIVAPPAVVITLIVALGCLAKGVRTRKGSQKVTIANPIENPVVRHEKTNPFEIVSE